ncbi:1,2-dihydroxy-3-keto-5-methylthiopentene dioxygenase [Streptomyces leeuwenhoekii]|uniref:Acireductone dioxygenase n=1 Tax=Streptomyces leeuwenhoekii TaxID=1437453 RepID=A0A0F7VLG0_STRLW|nr:cupin domain-containing protein [Streptomyces leeuwenhoekii]CQR59550.1 Acireductone dioxygenase 1 [Streptomyces leeuwenhoekii]
MTVLQIMTDSGRETLLRTTDPARIGTELAAHGVEFRRWPTDHLLPAAADQDTVLALYRDQVDRLCAQRGFRLVDVARMQPRTDDPDWAAQAAAARRKFLSEHRHSEDEVRFFVEGRGCFYLHLENRVYAVVCEAGDLLSVPAGTKHWYDMGEVPHFCAIRFFEEDDGWVGDFTEDPVAERIPSLDDLMSRVGV